MESKETLVMEIEAQAHYNLTDGKSLVNTKQTDSMNDDITEKVKRPEERTEFNKRQFEEIFFRGATASSGPTPPHNRGFMIRLRYTTVGRTPLDE